MLGHAPCDWFPKGRGPLRPLARTPREASFAPPSPQERGGTVLALAPCVAGRLRSTAARPRALCAPARSRSRPRSARLSQSVCRSLSSEQEERRGFREPAARLFSFPSLSPVPYLSYPSPAFACAAMAEPSAATQSPSVSSSSSGAEPSAPGGGSPGACPALGAKSCGSSCAGEARRGNPALGGMAWGSGKANCPRLLEASVPGNQRLENGLRGRGA